jgi:hypothetical protein
MAADMNRESWPAVVSRRLAYRFHQGAPAVLAEKTTDMADMR